MPDMEEPGGLFAASLQDARLLLGCFPRALPGAIILLSLRDGHLRWGTRTRQ